MELMREEGFQSLYKGLTPVMLRAFPANAVTLWLKRQLTILKTVEIHEREGAQWSLRKPVLIKKRSKRHGNAPVTKICWKIWVPVLSGMLNSNLTFTFQITNNVALLSTRRRFPLCKNNKCF